MTWSIHRRPQSPFLIASAVLALSLGTGGGWLFQALMLEPRAYLGWLAGTLISLSTFALLRQGARARRDGDELVYGFGRRDDLALPLAAIRTVRLVHAGLLRGVGVEIDPACVRFLTRKAASPARCAAWRAGLGVDVVLEHLTAADVSAINDLRRPVVTAEG